MDVFDLGHHHWSSRHGVAAASRLYANNAETSILSQKSADASNARQGEAPAEPKRRKTLRGSAGASPLP